MNKNIVLKLTKYGTNIDINKILKIFKKIEKRRTNMSWSDCAADDPDYYMKRIVFKYKKLRTIITKTEKYIKNFPSIGEAVERYIENINQINKNLCDIESKLDKSIDDILPLVKNIYSTFDKEKEN